MMRPRLLRTIALVLAILAACTAVLGWDAVYEQRITDTFIEDPQPSDKF